MTESVWVFPASPLHMTFVHWCLHSVFYPHYVIQDHTACKVDNLQDGANRPQSLSQCFLSQSMCTQRTKVEPGKERRGGMGAWARWGKMPPPQCFESLNQSRAISLANGPFRRVGGDQDIYSLSDVFTQLILVFCYGSLVEIYLESLSRQPGEWHPSPLLWKLEGRSLVFLLFHIFPNLALCFRRASTRHIVFDCWIGSWKPVTESSK